MGMKIDEAIKELEYVKKQTGYADIALDMAIKALEQQPSDDCISRAKALEMLGDEPENWTDTEKEIQEVNDYRWFKSILEELPSVTPQQKIGRWEFVQYDSNPNIGNWHCSECRTIIPHMPVETDRTPIYKWCPMCGAKMEVNADDGDSN